MLEFVRNRIDRILGIDGLRPVDLELIEERVAGLQPKMMWLYLLLGCYSASLALSLRLTGWASVTEVALGGFIVLRLNYWVRNRRRPFCGEQARSALRAIGIGCMVVSACYCLMLISSFGSTDMVHWQIRVQSGAICAIASAQTLVHLPRAAWTAMTLLGLPAALLALYSGIDFATSLVGLNLMLCIGISSYMLKIQDGMFVRQFRLRIEASAERERAEQAERRALHEEAHARAVADSDFLTGLPNRRAFLAAFEAAPGMESGDSVMIFDLDGFKPVNDMFGHSAGDEVLKQVSARLLRAARPGTLPARLGGDEFAVIARGIGGDAAMLYAQDIVAELGRPYQIGSSTIALAASCGLATIAPGACAGSDPIREADLALYRAKSLGRGKVERYEDWLGEAVQRRSEIELALRVPGVEQEIDLVFQPIVDLRSMRTVAFEALARWSHSTLGPVAPSDFIPITEQIHTVEKLSDSLLDRAVREALGWAGGEQLSFNLSAVQLCSLGSADRVLAILQAPGLPPHRLQIEVTETAMMADLDAARRNLSELRRHCVEIVLDDFGAGYASIGYLREMSFDKLKLDGALLTACDTPPGAALLKGVVDLARALGIPCIAEHVETGRQVELLRSIGCAQGQGYWLGRPGVAAGVGPVSAAVPLQPPLRRRAG